MHTLEADALMHSWLMDDGGGQRVSVDHDAVDFDGAEPCRSGATLLVCLMTSKLKHTVFYGVNLVVKGRVHP